MFKMHNILGFCLTLAVLFAGTVDTQAQLLNEPTLCEAIWEGPTGDDVRFCLPNDTQVFPDPEEFTITSDEDPLFIIGGNETSILLTMNSGVSGDDLDGTGFRLIGLRSILFRARR